MVSSGIRDIYAHVAETWQAILDTQVLGTVQNISDSRQALTLSTFLQ